MIVVDTNVVSEVIKPLPSGKVLRWMAAQIAAIARSHGAAIATRDTGDFEDCGVELIDPWAQA